MLVFLAFLHKVGAAHNKDSRRNVKPLLLYSEKHLILQRADLVQNVDNLQWANRFEVRRIDRAI